MPRKFSVNQNTYMYLFAYISVGWLHINVYQRHWGNVEILWCCHSMTSSHSTTWSWGGQYEVSVSEAKTPRPPISFPRSIALPTPLRLRMCASKPQIGLHMEWRMRSTLWKKQLTGRLCLRDFSLATVWHFSLIVQYGRSLFLEWQGHRCSVS